MPHVKNLDALAGGADTTGMATVTITAEALEQGLSVQDDKIIIPQIGHRRDLYEG